MRRDTQSLLLALVLLVGVGLWGYFTAQLPLGLSTVLRPPGGPPATPITSSTQPDGPAAGGRVAAGQPLAVGAVTVSVQGVQRRQEVATPAASGGLPRGGPPGAFAIVLIAVQNDGREPLELRATDFRLQDERGRGYGVDLEASRSASQAARRRPPFEASVPPGGRVETALAFEAAPDAGALTLRVALGYGELELPR